MKIPGSEANALSSPSNETPKKLVLHKPVVWGEGEDQETIRELEFGEITAGDMEDLAFPLVMGGYLRLASRSTGMPYPFFRKLSPTDAVLVSRLMDSFFDAGRLIGSS